MSQKTIKEDIEKIILKYKDNKNNFNMMAEIAYLRNGSIKDGEVYINTNTKMTFIDKLGNEFKATPSNIKCGKWSPYESKNIRNKDYHIRELQKIALSKGGQIKEGEKYINNKIKMTFIDKFNNEFQMAPSNVKLGQWSPHESKKVRDPDYHIQELQQIALSKGGKIKEGERYINNKTKMSFIDKFGNEFKMKPSHVKGGHWSPYESGHIYDSNYHMLELNKIAIKKGGKIKEGEIYINNTTKITFIDQLNNEFQMAPSNVKLGKWSPYEKNFSENICRQIIEQIYQKKFPSTYNLLKRNNGNRLQLDGYCKELSIAFEYQGIQHFIGWGNDESKRIESLVEIQKRDAEKKQECREKNIILLEINFYKNIKNVQSLIEQTIFDIRKSYAKMNIELPLFISEVVWENIKIDFSKISLLVLMRKELKDMVSKNDGKIKDGEEYINNNTKMTFIDKLGNEFRMTPAHVKGGRWSPYESNHVFNNPDYHMKQLQDIASSKGGRIKDGERYINNKTKITFIDKSGNEFQAIPNNIKNGRWSPYEAKNFSRK